MRARCSATHPEDGGMITRRFDGTFLSTYHSHNRRHHAEEVVGTSLKIGFLRLQLPGIFGKWPGSKS